MIQFILMYAMLVGAVSAVSSVADSAVGDYNEAVLPASAERRRPPPQDHSLGLAATMTFVPLVGALCFYLAACFDVFGGAGYTGCCAKKSDVCCNCTTFGRKFLNYASIVLRVVVAGCMAGAVANTVSSPRPAGVGPITYGVTLVGEVMHMAPIILMILLNARIIYNREISMHTSRVSRLTFHTRQACILH